jgi:DNA-binding transcriptional regulator YiaG
LNAALAALRSQYPAPMDAWDREDYAKDRAALRGQRATEVRRLRHLPVEPWSHGQLADALGVSRASIQQWERPGLDRRRT